MQERRKIRRRIANRESARRVRAAKAEQMQVMNGKVGGCRHAEPADCSSGSQDSPLPWLQIHLPSRYIAAEPLSLCT